jgi:hypothetical protein
MTKANGCSASRLAGAEAKRLPRVLSGTRQRSPFSGREKSPRVVRSVRVWGQSQVNVASTSRASHVQPDRNHHIGREMSE